jgi:membrane-associated phospholipid phosphatase
MHAIASFAFTMSLLLAPFAALCRDAPSAVPAPRAMGWLVTDLAQLETAPPPADSTADLNGLKSLAATRSDGDVARARWWDAGGPAYRWNELAVDALLDDFVTLPLAARHLALLHAAIDDAVWVADSNKRKHRRPRPTEVDASLTGALPTPSSPSYPSDFAAAAAVASEVLGYLLPSRGEAFAARAADAMRSRLVAGLEYPSDVAAGREIGLKIAALAIAHGKRDGSDAKWSGTVPQGPGKWTGANPIAPLTGAWRPWVLTRADEFRPPAPPEINSARTKVDLVELKEFPRTPKTNHRAIYWEVFGGARAHALWNETARLKLLEYAHGFDAQSAARVFAALNIAFHDATVACWEAKYAYWHIRPSQLDAEVKPVFPPPNHPSYPAAHGCLSTAAATVLARAFPDDRERLLALGKEAAEARIWAGIHYRFDIEAGQELGRKVAEKTLARAFADGGR